MKRKAERTPPWTIGLVALCTLLIAASQVLLKRGLEGGIAQILSSPYTWIGVAIMAAGGLLMMEALKRGELSVLYPVVALGYVWVIIAGIFLGERLDALHLSGAVLIVAGVSLIGRTGREA